MNRIQNDNRYSELKQLLSSATNERMELFENHERMAEQIKDQSLDLNGKIDMNFQRLWNFTEDVEKHVQQTLEVQRKTIKNTKVELLDILETKQENMQRQFETELSKVKSKYEDAVAQVEEASTNLRSLFKGKVKKIKEKSALFFAKMEMKLNLYWIILRLLG